MRKHLLRVRLNEAERAALMRKSEATGLSQADCIRDLIMNVRLVERPCIHHAALLSELGVITNALPQIFRRANEEGNISDETMADLRELLAKTWVLISDKY